MNKKQNPPVEVKTEVETSYFSTPNTSLDQQRQVTGYDSFDASNEAYRKSTARVVIKKYVVK